MLELLAPAGSLEALGAAIGEGADAVYLGLKSLNTRMSGANFTYSQFEGALRALHRMGKKLYVTVNTVFEQREADRMYQLLKYLAEAGPDALIVQDFGVVTMARSCFPSLRLHASAQMNIAGSRGANALSRHGLSRVACELSLEELKAARAETNMELEVFAHGALCVSVSGLCLFSSFMGGKSANRGMCTQACRRQYHSDDGEGCYFSPGDLQLLRQVPDLAAAGVNALRIEGRMKGADYVAAVVSAYRLVVDAVAEGDGEKIQRSIEKGQAILRKERQGKSKRYEPVIPRNTKGGHIPGREKAPIPKINLIETQPRGTQALHGGQRIFPEGLYAAVSRIEDLYILQSSRPVQVMLSLNRTTASYLLSDNKPPLPFKPAGIILVLDPYFPQIDAEPLSSEIGRLVEKGYVQYMLNNPGHFSLFRGHGGLKLIAGPWLYMFNRWAVSFAASWDPDAFVSPLENNRQNLERTLSSGDNLRSRFFIPVFAWPPLFRIRKGWSLEASGRLGFSSFSSSRKEYFSLISGQEDSVVISQTPFSITDKIQFLKEAGFGRFIIDLTGPVLKKSDYRDLMRAVIEKTPLPHISRFNWKDGFFHEPQTIPE